MTLTVSRDVAQSALSVAADRTSILSRNIANAQNPQSSRKIANVVSVPGSGVRIASITRASNDALLEKMLNANSDAAGQKAIVDALQQLDQTTGDPEQDMSPAALVQKLTDAIQQYAAGPQDASRASTAIAAAGDVATGLNEATTLVQQVRQQADADMASSVDRLNTLLKQFDTVNTDIVNGTRIGADVTDQLDQRDQILSSISEELGIRTVARSDGDMAVFTDSGVTLYDAGARAVTFNRTLIYGPGTTGNAVLVDGVPVTGSSGTMLAGSGRLAALANVRDNLTVTYQSQLDEVARGLIEAFAESDQSAVPALPDAAGLFTYAGGPAMPATGVAVVGLAGTIRLNPTVDPQQGGDPSLFRDGGIAGAAYTYNTTGATGYADRLQQYIDNLTAQRPFDPAAGLVPSASIGSFASSSVSWLQQTRQTASSDADYKNVLLERASDALSKVTGVNLDEEMTSMLELERSYQASARLISTIDSMMQALLSMTVAA